MLTRGQTLNCEICDQELSQKSRNYNAKTCSRACSIIRTHQNNELHSAYPGVVRGTVGAISELRAGIDLLVKGYAVFQALSPSCPSDLAILKDGVLVTIEVRTAYWNRAHTKRVYSTGNMYSDVYALVIGDEPVYYEPPLDEVQTIWSASDG